MKSLLLVFSFFSLASFGQFIATFVSTDERIEVVFNNQMEFDDLVKIRSELKNKGITLGYKKLIFDSEKKLSEIAFEVDCKDGFSGSAACKLDNQTKIGFYRDYTKDSESPFGTGNFEN